MDDTVADLIRELEKLPPGDKVQLYKDGWLVTHVTIEEYEVVTTPPVPLWKKVFGIVGFTLVGFTLGIIGLALMFGSTSHAQTVKGFPAYTLTTSDGVVLATDTGRYVLEMGYGCNGYWIDQNVDLLPGSGGVAAIAPLGTTDTLCNVLIAGQVSDEPCATNADGACDLAFDGG
jgi:hypothetical protein